MKPLSSVKADLEFNKGLSSLIETLKSIAVSQFRSLEKKIKAYKELIERIEDFLDFIDFKKVAHPFMRPSDKPQIVVAVTSDSGLLGGLNMQVINTAVRHLGEVPGKLIIVGERGKMYVRGSEIPCAYFPGIDEDHRYGQAGQMRDYIIEKIASDGFGSVKVVYPHPVSFTVQRVESVQFLPYMPAEHKARETFSPDIIMESSRRDAVEYLMYLWMGQRFCDIFGLSRLAEYAARYMHLEESTQKLKEIDKKTRLEYFRIRHELVDRTMRELFAGRALYAKGR